MRKAWSRKQKAMDLKREKTLMLTLSAEERLIKEKQSLNQSVKKGTSAKLASEFVDMVLADAETLALSRLADVNSDLNSVRADYRAALALYQKVQNIIYQGKVAEEKLKAIKEREGKQ